VISAGRNLPEWMALQAELPQLSSNRLHVIVEDATHASLALGADHARLTSALIVQVVNAASNGTPLAGR
jgi:hypothetical protein